MSFHKGAPNSINTFEKIIYDTFNGTVSFRLYFEMTLEKVRKNTNS